MYSDIDMTSQFAYFRVEPVRDKCFGGRTSVSVYKIVERRGGGDALLGPAHVYFISHETLDFNALIDSASGDVGDLRAFLEEAFKADFNEKPFLLINSHSHAEHVGANHRFCTGLKRLVVGCRDICAGGADMTFTKELLGGSDASGCSGATVKRYTITRWLSDGDVIELCSRRRDLTMPESRLHVIETPGHTPDSISLYFPMEQLLFVGDFLYRWAPILVCGEGSDLTAYEKSAKVLLNFVKSLPEGRQIRLCCGHCDDYLDWQPSLESLVSLLKAIRTGKAKRKQAPPDIAAGFSWPLLLYETRDASIRLVCKYAPPQANG